LIEQYNKSIVLQPNLLSSYT